MENQKIQVEVDGVLKEAEVLKMVGIDDKEYVIYTVDNGDGTSDVFSSEVVKNQEGFDEFVDIEDAETKKYLMELINVMLS